MAERKAKTDVPEKKDNQEEKQEEKRSATDTF